MKTIFMLINLLSSYQIVWQNTHFKIPLNENTHVYYEVPKAIVYDLNDQQVETEVYYQRGVNHTTLKVVNSLHVKTFKIDYKAYFPLIGKEAIETITFEIIDNIEPEFLYIPEIKMPIKNKLKTEKEIVSELIYQDNYYDNKELIVRISGLEGVNINIPGQYKIIYELIDPSFNIKREIRYYQVYNNIPPEIKVKSPIKVEYGNSFDYQNYFTFIDNFNRELEVYVDDSQVNTKQLGFYNVYVSVVNLEGLKTEGNYQIEIVDTKLPTLIVKTPIVINYLEVIELKSLIIEVSDNYNELNIEDVIITGYYDNSKLGKYDLVYEVSDSSNNKKSVKVMIEIIDLVKPEINMIVEKIIVNVGEKILSFTKYFDISDNYTSRADLKVNYDDKAINYNTIGLYYLNIEVTDESKNKSIKEIEVYIEDLKSPNIKINFNEYILIDQYGYLNDSYFKKYFIISDNYYDNQLITIEINEPIDFFSSQEIKREFIFKDPSNNQTIVKDILIIVLETRAPIIELKTKSYKYYIGEEKINLDSFVKSFYDYTNNTNDLSLEIIENIDYEKVGLYVVTFKGNNVKINNQTTKELLFYVDLKQQSNSEVSNLTVSQYEIIEDLCGFTLSDDVINYEIFPKKVNTTIPGIKSRKIVLYDQRGNTKILTQEIEVIESKEKPSYRKVIIYNGIMLTISIGYLIFEKRKRTLF